jgi:5-methylcytosine-specific restriction endonuclease McrA
MREYRKVNIERISEYQRRRRETNKEYMAEYNRRWREANLDYVKEQRRKKYHANKEEAKAKTAEWQRNNKDKVAARNRRWRQANPQKNAAIVRAWHKKNPEMTRATWIRRRARASAAPGDFTAADIQSLFELQNGLCAYHLLNPHCHVNLENGYTVDHIIPLVRGGTNYPDNLQLLCPHCNPSKGAKTHDEYLEYLAAILNA